MRRVFSFGPGAMQGPHDAYGLAAWLVNAAFISLIFNHFRAYHADMKQPRCRILHVGLSLLLLKFSPVVTISQAPNELPHSITRRHPV